MNERWDHFWDAPILRARVTAFRVVFFGLLGFDLWLLMLPHAPRHLDGSFNVSHVPVLDPFLPDVSTVAVTVAYLFAGFLALRVAVGLASRASVVVLTVVYSAVYFHSQLDSYQHHYLICLLLLLCCFVPWKDVPGLDRPADPADPSHIQSPAMRLIYVQVSIVYLFTAITKVNADWLDGWALNRIIHEVGVREIYAAINEALGWSDLGMYAFVAHTIMVWQFFVAVAFLFPRLRPLACITGPMFHILVEVIDLKIGWFSYYMIGIYYLLLFPDQWFLWLARPLRRPLRAAGALIAAAMKPGEPATRYLAVATGALVALATFAVPSEGNAPLAGLLAAATVFALWPRSGLPTTNALSRALAHAAIVFVMVGALRASDAPYDYYRFWAGDLARRGHFEEAVHMYGAANALRGSRKPARHRQLGRVLARLGRSDEAEQAYEEALRRDPQDEVAQRELRILRAERP